MVEAKYIISFFNQLNQSGLDYILIRNINEELPLSLERGKDIDLLVKKQNQKDFRKFFFANQYKEIEHPFSKDTYLYTADKPIKFLSSSNAGVWIDLNFQALVRSLDAGQWIPLDNNIQESLWENRKQVCNSNDFSYWALSEEDEFVLLVARAIFDKKCFTEGYLKRIKELWPLVNKPLIEEKFNQIFFKFSFCLMELIEKHSFQEIIEKYLTFVGY